MNMTSHSTMTSDHRVGRCITSDEPLKTGGLREHTTVELLWFPHPWSVVNKFEAVLTA